MRSQMLVFFFILLCAQCILSTLALESIEDKGKVGLNGDSYSGKDGLKRDDLVLSKASKGKGSYGGQNDRPPTTKNSKAISMLAKPPAFMSNISIGAIVLSMVFYF